MTSLLQACILDEELYLLVYPSVRKSVKPPITDISKRVAATFRNSLESLPRAISRNAESMEFIRVRTREAKPSIISTDICNSGRGGAGLSQNDYKT